MTLRKHQVALERQMQEIIKGGKTEKERNFRYLFLLMMVEQIKGDLSQIEVFRATSNGAEIYSVVISASY